MSDENQQSIFSDFESHIHEREWNKAAKKIKAARRALFIFALLYIVAFCGAFTWGAINYVSLGIAVMYLFLFYISRSKPIIAFALGSVAYTIISVLGIRSIYISYQTIATARQILPIGLFISVMMTLIFLFYLIRGIIAAKKLKHLETLENSI